jgi:hypothetical protein
MKSNDEDRGLRLLTDTKHACLSVGRDTVTFSSGVSREKE